MKRWQWIKSDEYQRKLEKIKAKTALAEQKKGAGTIKTEILYKEADGIWLIPPGFKLAREISRFSF